MYESPMTLLNISYTLARGPLNLEEPGIKLSSLKINPALAIRFPRGLFLRKHRHIRTVHLF